MGTENRKVLTLSLKICGSMWKASMVWYSEWLKQKLKERSKTTFCKFTNKRNNLLELLADIDRNQDNRDLTENEMMVRITNGIGGTGQE